jgi:hypothetical protein
MAFDSLSPEAAVKKWNERFPVGTPVRYWTGARVGHGQKGKTRTLAEGLNGHTAVLWLEGVSGCVALSHIQPEPKLSRAEAKP